MQGYGATVMKFNGTTWETVGDPRFSGSEIMYSSIAFDSEDIPYVAYSLNMSNIMKSTVMKFNGTNWETVGTVGFSAGRADYTSIAIDSNNIPYASYKDGANSNKATVMKFNGTNWETVGTAGFSESSVDNPSIAIDSNNLLYVGYSTGARTNMMKFDGSNWVAVDDNNPYGFSEYYTSSTSIALDSNGIPYVAYLDYAHDAKATVMKFNSSTELTGTPTNADVGVNYVNLTLSDGTNIIEHNFQITIWPTEDGEDIREVGVIHVTTDENGTSTTLEINENLSVQTTSYTNTNAAYKVTVAGSVVQATSELMNSVAEFTSSGAHITYSDENLSLKVNATVTGGATHEMSVGGVVTKLISEFVGASTKVDRDGNGNVEIVTSVAVDANTSVSVTARADGTAEHKVIHEGIESKAISLIIGASTLITTAGEVQTIAGAIADGSGYDIKAMVITKANGTSITRFVKVSQSDANDMSILGNTLSEKSAFASGNSVEISEIDGILYMRVVAPLDVNLVIE
jgi:hypothetical protein